MKNVAGKRRDLDHPYAQWTDPMTGFEYRLLKSNQADNSKEFAVWFMAVKTKYTFGHFEYGDEYVKGGLRGTLLRAEREGTLKVDESIWTADDDGYNGQFSAWAWGER